MKKSKKKPNLIIYIIMAICLCMACISIYKIMNWYNDINRNNEIKENINKQIIEKDDKYEIDFDQLKKENEDIVAYLKVNGTNIDYVVVQGNDNDYYLHHNLKKEYSIAGWIFATYQNKLDDTDKNIVVFGHNMRDGSMFGSMKNILKENWYNNEENLKVTFITEKGSYTYQVFSVYQIKVEDYYIKTSFSSDEEFKTFINTIKNRSVKDFKTEVTEKDSILTLSTCSATGKERVVLHAKKI